MDAVVVQVRDGDLVGAGSWVYAWVAAGDGRVIHVGATSLPPAVRTWLHLHDPDPSIGRVAAAHPEVFEQAFDVVAITVPAGVERAHVRDAVSARLAESGRFDVGLAGDGASPEPGSPRGEEVAALVQALLDAVDQRARRGGRLAARRRQ